MKRTHVSLAIFVFFSFSFLAGGEQFLPVFEPDSQSYLSPESVDFFSGTSSARRALKRSQRAKTSLKSLPKPGHPSIAVFAIAWIKQDSAVFQYLKPSVYQQLNVYRI